MSFSKTSPSGTGYMRNDHHYERLMDDAVAMAKGGHGGILGEMDPGNPQNWPLQRKVAFGMTSYALAIPEVVAAFNVSRTAATLPFSIYLFGIAFAPIYTPHLSERFGRAPVYFVSIPICALFIFGAARAPNFGTLLVTRFFAGFFGGPSLVLIEGTYADVWPDHLTVSYYSVLALSSYIGAAAGPLVSGFVITAKGWRWSQYVAIMIALAAYLLGIGMPETYAREIVRSRARRAGKTHNLPKAQSGTVFAEMARITVITPLAMLFTEPIVFLSTLYLAFLFGTMFQFFVLIPVVLRATYDFSIQRVGIAFAAAITGSILAATACMTLNRIAYNRAIKKNGYKDNVEILEHRLLPAIFGGIFMTASFFWIGYTAVPHISYLSPVLGTCMYVWGNMMVLCSLIPYLFDAYPPSGTLSALTVAASVRLIIAGVIPLVIIQDATNLGGKWALSIFGFVSLALAIIPFVLYRFGEGMRRRSRYSAHQKIQRQSRDGASLYEMDRLPSLKRLS